MIDVNSNQNNNLSFAAKNYEAKRLQNFKMRQLLVTVKKIIVTYPDYKMNYEKRIECNLKYP